MNSFSFAEKAIVFVWVVGLTALTAAVARAGEDDGGEGMAEFETVVEGEGVAGPDLPSERAVTRVTRDDMDRRLPRSAPDALRFEPGVFVQQTAHGQGSAFIRGMTGQQTLLLFDGIRLNNSTWRQGPNQYFFTLDAATIASIEVMRGGGSTRWGSDALGGVVMSSPLEPFLWSGPGHRVVTAEPRLTVRTATADQEAGARLSTNLTVLRKLAFLGGVGARRVGELRSGGPIRGVGTGEVPAVPRFAADGQTQLGTGFNEFTADGVLRYRLSSRQELKLAAYTYRQTDAPRTDQCPAASAPWNECLMYDEQFRTLVYGAWQGEPGHAVFQSLRATLSFQQQHERTTLRRPAAHVVDTGRDDVNTVGGTLAGRTTTARPLSWLGLQLDYGIDTYADFLTSRAWISFSDIHYTQQRTRGQYLDGATYVYGGVFAEGTADVTRWLELRAGGRMSWIAADAQADPESGSASVDRHWVPMVWNAGVTVAKERPVSLMANVDRSFRAPNLDDLTSRQQTGPGFQFENADLQPETAMTYEAGIRVAGAVSAELWGFVTHLHDAIVRSPRSAADCPPLTSQCGASWNRYQLVNADRLSVLRGLEGVVIAQLPGGWSARGTIAWMWGEGPNTGDPPSDPTIDFPDRVPLSRMPPLNGTLEILWRAGWGLSAGAALRWAGAQTRLAVADTSDARIPPGGTPGFAVMDLRLGYRPHPGLMASLTLENLFDAAYRYHGSGVNGPGRGVMFLLDVAPVRHP